MGLDFGVLWRVCRLWNCLLGLRLRLACGLGLWGGWFSEFGCLILVWCCAGWDVCAGVWDCGLVFPGFEFVCVVGRRPAGLIYVGWCDMVFSGVGEFWILWC